MINMNRRKTLKDFGLKIKGRTYPIREYDANGNLKYLKGSDGFEWWKIEEGELELKAGIYYLNGIECEKV